MAFIPPVKVSTGPSRDASLSHPYPPAHHQRYSCSRQPMRASALSRRDFAKVSLGVIAAALSPQPPLPANAVSGLRLFPLEEPLTNTYFLMRACETISDRLGVCNSNPVNKLSIKMHGLTPAGIEQALRASKALVQEGVGSETWIWPSVTTSSFETAEIMAYNLNVRREQIVPEFSFLDARGVGELEGRNLAEVRQVITENDRIDSSWRPRPGEDGTPNDSSDDVFVRVRQLLSKLETQYFGENILILSPDSDPLSVLQAALMGKELTEHHKYEFQPGEVRYVQELIVNSTGEPVVPADVKIISKPGISSTRSTASMSKKV